MIDLSTITGLTQDSRNVKPGYLFAALPGQTVDGRDFIDDAIKAGATAVLTDSSLHGSSVQSSPDVEYIYDDTPRKAFAHLVAEFYNAQPETIVAVTGTNGKTSIVSFVEQIWQSLGYKAASLGTLSGSMTTADPVTLHEQLKSISKDGITHLALEASSHGLDQYRLDGVKIKAAGFTNLSHDHLDYHKDMDEYFTAKSRLFTELLSENGTAVINADHEYGQKLIDICNAKTITYGYEGQGIKLLSCAPIGQGQQISIIINENTYDFTLPLVGAFQAMNALCALGLVLASGDVDQDKAVKSLKTLKGAKGRLQFVDDHPKNAAIYVDYAHTPDALENVLNALRPHTEGKLICLFGCGGDRDKAKRPVMGEIVARLADEVIITDDNPRGEDPSSIRAAILSGAPNATEIADRRDAIHTTTQNLNEGDVLLVAGKGHEQGQIFADHTDPFDDVTEVQTAIQNL